MIAFLLIAAGVLFIFGYMAATSRFLFVALAWSGSFIALMSAAGVWLRAQFVQRD